jgi:hypothetical protein
MTQTIHGITESELFRLLCAYVSLRNPGPRHEILSLVESWACQQWAATDSKLSLRTRS